MVDAKKGGITLVTLLALLGGIFTGAQINTDKVYNCPSIDHYRICDKLGNKDLWCYFTPDEVKTYNKTYEKCSVPWNKTNVIKDTVNTLSMKQSCQYGKCEYIN